MAFDTLISATELLALCRQGHAPVLIECSFDLFDADAGERAWRAGHPDGAHYLHLDRDLAGSKTGTNGRHPLPERAAFARTLARCGITPQSQVVSFDRQGGVYAARLWWMLRWMGHADAAVLDGGVEAWLAAGGTLSTSEYSPASTAPYPDRKPLAAVCSALELAQSIGRVRLIDARAPERFRGEVEPLDAQAGHIPGALNRFFKENLAPGGTFKPAGELRAAFLPLLVGHDAEHVVHQCGSGVTACHNLLAMEVAGLTGSNLYPGSWSEWSADPARPVARG